MAARFITCGRVVWAIDSFAPYKSPGMDEIFPALLQEGLKVLIPYLVNIFRAYLATGYVPAIWLQVKVVFMPKPCRDSCGGPKNSVLSVSHRSYSRPWREWSTVF